MREHYVILSRYRLDKALEDYESALLNYGAGHYNAAANRAYYCVFHTIRSLLILNGVDYKKHSAVISDFRKHYVKTGIFENELSEIITMTSRLRETSDYEDLVVISQEKALLQIEKAKIFYDCVKPYIEKLLIEANEVPPDGHIPEDC